MVFQDAIDSEGDDDGDDDDDDDSEGGGGYPGGQKEGTAAAEQRPVPAEEPPAAAGKASGNVGAAAAGTEALGPKTAEMATVRPGVLAPRWFLSVLYVLDRSVVAWHSSIVCSNTRTSRRGFDRGRRCLSACRSICLVDAKRICLPCCVAASGGNTSRNSLHFDTFVAVSNRKLRDLLVDAEEIPTPHAVADLCKPYLVHAHSTRTQPR